MKKLLLLIALVLFATAASAQFTISPSSGPAAGNTVVTLKGPVFSPTPSIRFGNQNVPAWKIASDTILFIAPPGEPGSTHEIKITDDDVVRVPGLFYTYANGEFDSRERILLPLLIPPVNGAFGSRFVTELRGFNRSATQEAQIYGLTRFCICSPPQIPDPTLDHFDLEPRQAMQVGETVLNGTPGRFAFVPKNQIDHLWLNLRVHDASRSGENFGTELPIVRDRDLFHYEPIVFDDVPTDARFRNTLRIYADAAVKLTVEITGADKKLDQREITLPAPQNRFEPSYAQIGDLPVNAGQVRITITSPEPGQPGFYTAIWAFLSVTNNDTQLITTIRP